MAIQTIKGGLFLPQPDLLQWAGAPTFNSITLNAIDEAMAAVLAIPKTGNIKKILFATRTATTTSTNMVVRVETLDETVQPAIPSTTLYHADAATTVTVSSTDDNVAKLATFATAFPATKGDKVAIIIRQPAASAGDLQLARFDEDISNFPYLLQNIAVSPTVTWTLLASAPMIGIEYDDGSYEHIPGCWPIYALTNTAFNNTSTPDEIGNRFRVPFPCRVTGAWAYMDADGDFSVNLYDSDGVTKIAGGAYAVDKDTRGPVSAGYHYFTFSSTATLVKDTYYRLVIEPTSATSVTIYDFTVDSAAAMDAFDGGQSIHMTSAKNPAAEGDWTNTTTRRVWMGVSIDGFDDGAGGGDPISSSRIITNIGTY